ncbi:TetR/AcrR family transcriptional regulator [Microbacterium sp.]|uniref:TetR/AcrR family transcriptional regulator n=1 Tax=Microbacterium sp. TaxID=51671 RepID=UPI003C785740
MPKVVDHGERRAALIEATWRVIVADGLEAVTLRRVAAEFGFTNGAIRHFFSSKAELLEAALQMAVERTVQRAQEAANGARGIAGLRAWCLEIMPVTDVTRIEARIVIAFAESVATGSVAVPNRGPEWDDVLRECIREARDADEITSPERDADIMHLLTWMMYGLQYQVFLQPADTTAEVQMGVLDAYLRMLR